MKDLFHDSAPTTAAVRYSLGASPVSHSVQQGSAVERRMTVTSGQKCCALLVTSDRAGLLVKTLLASSRWYNHLTSLRWKASPICSERVTSFKRNAGNTPSTGSAKTLKPSDIPSGRWLFRPQAVGAPHRRDRVWFLASDAAADGEHWRAHDNPASAPASNATSKPRGRRAECEQQGVCGRRRSLAGYMNPAGVFCLKGRDTGTRQTSPAPAGAPPRR